MAPLCLLLAIVASPHQQDRRVLHLLADTPYLQPFAESVQQHAELLRAPGLELLDARPRVDGEWLSRGQRWMHGRYHVAGTAGETPATDWPVLGSDFWYVFSGRTGVPIACDLPGIQSAPTLAAPRLRVEDVPAAIGFGAGGAVPGVDPLEVLDLCVHPELGLVYPVVRAAPWAIWKQEPASLEELVRSPNERGWVDAATGRVVRWEPIPHHTLSGTLRGPAISLRGPAARRALSTVNPPTREPARGRTLELHETGQALRSTLTDENGAFDFELASGGLWGLCTLPVAPDFCWQGLANPEIEHASASGGARDVEVDLELEARHASLVDLAGQVTMWNVVATCRDWSINIRRRAGFPLEVLESLDGPEDRVPGIHHLQLWRFRSRSGQQPVIGAYSDTPWPPRMGTSTGNDLVNDGAIAAWHEYGHYEMLSLTGMRHLGGWPLSHDPAAAEAWADAYMDYALARADPEGDDRGWIGWGRDVGHEETAFHRDIARGLTMGPREADGHAEVEGGHDQWPNDEAEIHAAGMPVSGSFWLLRRLLLQRHGVQPGLERAEVLLYSWVGNYARGAVPAFSPLDVQRLLIADDAEAGGGDENFQNGSPNSREIKLAFAAHNLYFFDFVRGDANGDGRVDLADAIFTLSYLFLGGAQPGCLDAADADDSGSLELSDAVMTLGALFLAGIRLPPPDACGTDPTHADRFPCQLQPIACGDIR